MALSMRDDLDVLVFGFNYIRNHGEWRGAIKTRKRSVVQLFAALTSSLDLQHVLLSQLESYYQTFGGAVLLQPAGI